MGSRCIGHVRTIISIFAATVAFNASAAYWKNYTGDQLLDNTKNWFGTTDWTPEQALAWWPTTCMTLEEVTEVNGGWSNQPWAAILGADMSVRNIETGAGHDNISGSIDLGGHTLSTLHSDWGFFIKGQNNLIEISDGSLCVTGKVSIGDSAGNSDTLRVLPGGILHARAVGIGGGGATEPASTNNVLDVAGGMILFDVKDGNDMGWGYAVGEKPGDGGGMLLVRDGGIVSNFFNSALVGYKSCNNSIVVRDGGYYYNQVFLQLGQLDWDWNWPCTNNMIKAESGGVVEMHSGLYIGSGSSPSSTSRNVIWAGDGGRIICGGDVGVEGNENIFVVSNGYFCCNSLHSINEYDTQGYYGTRFVFAGASPVMQVYFYFSLRRQASLEFSVPNGGYQTTPLTVRNGCKVDEDTTLSVDVRGLLRGLRGGERAQIRLINADMDGYNYQKVYVPDDDESFTKLNGLIAKWNASLPSGVRVYLARERCELWLEATKPGLVVSIR